VDFKRGSFSWKSRVYFPQGGLSRNKVAVLEGAAGSPPFIFH